MTRALRAELRKLLAQLPVRLLALAAALGPLAFAAVLALQPSVPADTLFGIWVHSSGWAVSLVVLGFCGSWGFPVIAGVLAGDAFAAEDRHGTWKTLLTRSRSRRDVFAGKALAVGVLAVAVTALAAASSILAGLLVSGANPLVGLSGSPLGSGTALGMVLLSWLASVLPMLAFVSVAVMCSVLTRNGIAGVLAPILLALVTQLLALVGHGAIVHLLLVGSAFGDWHGLLTGHRFYGQLAIGCAVSAGWIAACLGTAWLALRRRDFAGDPVGARRSWPAIALRGVIILGGLALVAAACNWGPTSITPARLRADITPDFNNLTIIQQRLLGRRVPAGLRLRVLSFCRRRGTQKTGPGDDWYCTFDVLVPTVGAIPYEEEPITYDVSVSSYGCYKAESPPALVGPQQFRDAHGRRVTNPLFTLYGCLDVT